MFKRCVLALMFFMVAGLAQPLMACSCSEIGPPCASWGKTDAIFLGRVVDISSFEVRGGEANAGPFSFRETLLRVRFEVESPFYGVAVGTVEVVTSADSGGGCGYPFELNHRYLVYAGRDGETFLSTSMCSRTRRVENAAEDLAFFGSLKTAPAGARVYGQLGLRENDPLLEKSRFGPIAGARVTVEGPGGLKETVSDSQGRYQIAGLSAGDYDVKLRLAPESLAEFRPSSKSVKLDEQACAEVNAYAQPIGRISGWVSDADGRPVTGLIINVIPETMSNLDRRLIGFPYALTASDGSYEFQALPPGRYLVGVNLRSAPYALWSDGRMFPRTYFPDAAQRSDAQVVVLEKGGEQRGVHIVMPKPLQKREIRGIAVWSDGKRAKGARLSLSIPEYEPSPVITAEADANGEFSLPALAGLKYEIVAISGNDGKGERIPEEGRSLPIPVEDDETIVTLHYSASLKGRLVNAAGRPLAGVAVELLYEEASSKEEMMQSKMRRFLQTISDSEGRFEMRGIEPRRYVVAVQESTPPYPSSEEIHYPSAFYPGTVDRNRTAVIELKDGQQTQLKDFVLADPLTLVTVEGTVVGPDGRAVQSGDVAVLEPDFPGDWRAASGNISPDGRFTVNLYLGRRYVFKASTSKDREGRTSFWNFEGRPEEIFIDSTQQRIQLRISDLP